MSAPKAKWISMPKALGIIRRETQLPDPEIEAALLAALADHEIRSQHTIMYETDISGGSQQGQTIETPAGFWTQADFMRQYQDRQSLSCVPLYAPNDHEGWYFDVHYDHLLTWLSRESGSIAQRGRPAKWCAVGGSLIKVSSTGIQRLQACNCPNRELDFVTLERLLTAQKRKFVNCTLSMRRQFYE